MEDDCIHAVLADRRVRVRRVDDLLSMVYDRGNAPCRALPCLVLTPAQLEPQEALNALPCL